MDDCREVSRTDNSPRAEQSAHVGATVYDGEYGGGDEASGPKLWRDVSGVVEGRTTSVCVEMVNKIGWLILEGLHAVYYDEGHFSEQLERM